jgi:hypothetical protein
LAAPRGSARRDLSSPSDRWPSGCWTGCRSFTRSPRTTRRWRSLHGRPDGRAVLRPQGRPKGRSRDGGRQTAGHRQRRWRRGHRTRRRRAGRGQRCGFRPDLPARRRVRDPRRCGHLTRRPRRAARIDP